MYIFKQWKQAFFTFYPGLFFPGRSCCSSASGVRIATQPSGFSSSLGSSALIISDEDGAGCQGTFLSEKHSLVYVSVLLSVLGVTWNIWTDLWISQNGWWGAAGETRTHARTHTHAWESQTSELTFTGLQRIHCSSFWPLSGCFCRTDVLYSTFFHELWHHSSLAERRNIHRCVCSWLCS